MFLDHLTTLGLLQHDPSTDILKQFPLSVRQTLALQVVNVLLDSNAGARALTSVAHVRWAMESVGASFTLPMESEEIMSTAIELYRRWLLDSSKRPSPINSEPQFFVRQILCHYSLLFEPRTALPDSLDTQAALCKRALNIYHALGRESSALDEETWEIFLKLLLGIADSLLSLPESEEGLTKRLCSHVLKVLFELWLYSSTSEADMWGSLLHLVPRWVHHLPTINQWLAVCKGLTERAISFMYGPEEGRECVLIQLEGSKEIVTMDGLQEEHVFYAWHRMLHAIGDPNSIANPRIHHAAFKGIDTLVDLFLQVGRKSGKAERQELKPPEGNTILHIFGSWLFDAAMQRRDGFEEGRAVAVKTLCNIFSTCKSSPFNTVYLSRFYACLSQVLGESTEVMIAGLTNAGILFPCELPGFRILTPSFVYALNRVLLRRLHFEHAGAQENVRRECLRILGYLISTPNHFSDTPFSRATPKPPVINTPASPKDTLSAKLPEIKTFRQVDDHLVVLLGESLVYETAGGNVRPLLSLCYAFARETHLKRPDFTLHVIHTIVQKITHAQWLTGHCVDAYRVLGFFSAFYAFLPDPDETANYVVSSLANMFASEAIGDLLTRLAPSEFEIHMMEALECITCWLMVGPPWIYQYHKTKAAVINAIMSVLHSSSKPGVQGELKTSLGTSESDQSRKDRKTKKLISRKGQRGPQQAKAPNVAPLHPAPKLREPSPRLREVAAHALATMINHMGNYPNPSGTTCLSTLLSEEDVLKLLPDEVAAKIDPAQFVRYFISGSTIYTVIDRPNNGDGYVTLIVRDRTGKYAWDLQSVSLSQENEKLLEGAVLAHPKEISLEPYTIPVPPKGEADLPNMAKFIDNKRSLFVSAQAKQAEKEKKYLRKHDWGLNADIRCFPVWASQSPYAESESKFIQGRMLVSQLGFLSPQQRANFHQIDQSPAFFRSLKNLDRTPERECISVGVLYLGKGQTKKKVWANSAEHVSRSPAYQRFLDASGWTVDVATHPGWVGQLDRTGKTGARTLYYADYNKEMVYLVGSMMNTDVKTKKKLIKSSSNTALILWTEEEIDLVMWYDWVFAICPIVIAVRPLPSGLFYTCTLNKNAEVIHVGPLQEEGVVGMNELGVLVRETALSAYKGLKRSLADYSHPFTVRAGMINDIGAKFGMPNLTPQQYFNSLFSRLPSDKLFPYSSPSSPPAAVPEAARRKPRPCASLVPETAEYRLPSPPPSYRALEVSPRVSVESSDSSVGGSRRTSEDKGSPRKRRSSTGLATSASSTSSSSEIVPIAAMSVSAPFQSMPSLSAFTSPGDSGSSPSAHSSPSLGSNSVSIRPKDVQFEKHAMPLPTRQAPVPLSKSGGDAKSGAVAALKKNEASGGRSSLPAVAVSDPPPRPLASSVSSGPAASGSRQSSSEPPFDRIPVTTTAGGADDPLGERKASKEKKSKKDAALKKNKKHKSDGSVSFGGSSEDTATATPAAAGSGSVSCDNLAAVTEGGESSKKRERREKRASRKSLSHEITHAIITHANADTASDTANAPSLATSSSPSLPSPPREDKGAKVAAQRTVVQPFVPPAGAAGLPEPTRQAPERPTLP